MNSPTVIFAVLWVAFALASGLLLSKLMKLIHFPNVTGFLIGGIIIGPWLFGSLIQSREAMSDIVDNLGWISEIALGFIAFTIGGSFKLSALKKVGKRATVISVAEALGGSIVVIGVLFLGYFLGLKNCGLSIPMILILGAIACATAPAATLLVVNQYKAKGPVTETLIPVVAFDDAVALIAFSVLFSIAKIVQIGGAFDPIKAIVIPLLQIIISLVIGAIFGFIISLATRWFKSRHNRLILIISAVLICVGLAQIDTQKVFGWSFSFQLSSLLTVMALGGVYVNFAKGLSTTNEYLDKFTSPIFMLFFVISGANLNFSVFADKSALIVIAIAAIYLTSRVLGKWLGSAFGSKVTSCPPVVQKYLGFTLVPQAGVALGLAANAKRFFEGLNVGDANPEAGKLGTLIYTIIIVSTMIYELVGPLVTKWALIKAGEIDPKNA